MGIIAAGALALLLLATPMGDRFLDLGLSDSSVAHRFKAFNLLGYLSPLQLITGINFSTYSLLLEMNPELGIIENFWINLLASFGLILFVPFLISLGIFFRGMAHKASPATVAALIGFLLIASTNNSLSTKTLAFMLFLLPALGLKTEAKRS